jgi:sugar lactone lactonase YvrE
MFQSLLVDMALRKASDSKPQISQISPAAAIAGGELQIRGKGFTKPERPRVIIGEVGAPVIIGSDSLVIARVPEAATAGEVVIASGKHVSESWACDIGILIGDGLHPVSNPVLDSFGNIYSTFSGSRGQKVPVAVYKIDLHFNMKPFINEMMNATGLAFDPGGLLYVSSRHDGMVYQVTPNGNMSVFVEGMGVATGIAFDREQNLYVGDRSGTIFKINPNRQIFVFATLEPSLAAYHLAFGADDHLYVTGPTTSSFDSVHRISSHGEVEVFYRGLGRPQGMAFDEEGRLYVAASIGGRKGVVRIYPPGRVGEKSHAELFLSGPGIVGLAFAPSRAMVVATTNALYRVDVGIKGLPLVR